MTEKKEPKKCILVWFGYFYGLESKNLESNLDENI